ncbi:hypothetical protein CsSME_00034476 [Camellia sinensis var. sinensis]
MLRHSQCTIFYSPMLLHSNARKTTLLHSHAATLMLLHSQCTIFYSPIPISVKDCQL